MNDWSKWFAVDAKTLGFQDAYKRLRSHIKFHNTLENTVWWVNGMVVKTDECEEISHELIRSAAMANKAIEHMMAEK